MPKAKNKKAAKGGASAKAAPKCTCDHPYNCSCGNRPERPSKGHKWDPETQQWGGKGHKQKGASGQTASVSQEAKTTAVGKTQVSQWQRLPSQLLQEWCKKQKRRPPKFKSLDNVGKKDSAKMFKFRVIVPDPKKTENDLFFVPAHPVANEEQAKEESALLALLGLTPALPHERKLPEPYRTTWLNAVAAAKQANSDGKKAAAAASKQNDKSDSKAKNGGAKAPPSSASAAQASTMLTMGKTYSSNAEKRQMQNEKRREKNARFRRHENIRIANLPHQVFMSSHVRHQIESLLRGEAVHWEDDDEEEEENKVVDDSTISETQRYAQERLHDEGFTRRQARTAFEQVAKEQAKVQRVIAAGDNEEEWEMVYEECLQWLLVHLNEDQLPEGFDPRGGTLDVVVAGSDGTGTTKATGASSNSESKTSSATGEATTLASHYGLSVQEARHVLQIAQKESKASEDVLWAKLVEASGSSLDGSDATTEVTEAENKDALREEMEALEAIFPSECKVSATDSGSKNISIDLSELGLVLQVIIREGLYPAVKPDRVWITGKWSSPSVGAALHIETIKFMAELAGGDPMVFELHGHVQSLLEDASELSAQALLPLFGDRKPINVAPKPDKGKATAEKRRKKPDAKATRTTQARRPREGRPFWSKPPSKTPPAEPFPIVPPSMERVRKSLPAAGAKKEFLSKLRMADEGGRVLLVTGDTGCGKTTQIPQYVLEELPKDAKIVIAQPRRLAATGVAARVADERGEDKPGVDSVGYVVRGDSALSARSRLVFCTTGILLRQLQSEAALDCITHIIVDEVHERQLDSDILLGLLKQCLPRYPRLRVILMSATLDADRFASYWGKNTPRMHIPGRTFPVEDYTLEDVLSLTGYVPRKSKKGRGYSRAGSNNYYNKRSSPWDDSEKSDNEEEEESGADLERDTGNGGKPSHDHGFSIEELVQRVDETSVDYDLIAQLVKRLVLDKDPSNDGSILVFLSGAPEINNAMETIKRCTKGLPITVLPLHGGLQPRDQNLVFRPAQKGYTKVILSTNVAETSITIPDCTIVIDSAREKQASYDPANRMPLLVEHFASKASLKQRRGRAGRVREGTCYKLISRSTLEKLSDHGEPEIKRSALEQTLLSLLFLGVETGAGTFMRTLLDPPSKESLRAASTSLMQIGAVRTGGGEDELELTPLGVHLAGIPAPPTVGKMLVMGAILGCRDAALAMAAGMSIGRSPFLRLNFPRKPPHGGGGDDNLSMEEMKNERIVEERSVLFQSVGASDHAFLAAVFQKWKETGTGSGMRRRLCDSLGLSFNSMRDMSQLVQQLDSSLRALGFGSSSEANRNGKSWRIIRACAVSAMAPSQLVKLVRPAATYSETAEGAKQKDDQARELKFFIRTPQAENQSEESRDERVFIHPSSANFSCGTYSCPWLVYHSMVRTSKPFLRDVTECDSYPLLLFGGELQVKASSGLITVDDWVTLSANARIGSLMAGLRRKVDSLLTRKVEDPSFEIATTDEMKIIVKLCRTDGLGTK